MNNRNAEDNTYVDQLTWLRGIAAFFVIVSHSIRATEVKYTETDEQSSFFLLSLLDLGFFGVVLFFVLSGCTLYISNANKVTLQDIPSFYVKRFFRIWPAFIVSLLFYICFGAIFSDLYIQPQGHWIEKQFLSSYSLSDIILYLSLIFNITGPSELFNNAYWSLPVEFQYYLIFPLIVASIRFAGVAGPVCIGLALFLIPKFNLLDAVDNTAVFSLAYSFCGGVFIGYLYKNTPINIDKKIGIALLLVLLLLAIMIKKSYINLPNIPFISNKVNWYSGIAIASVYLALFTRVSIPSKIEAFLKQFGSISYSTYLYHNLFIGIAVLSLIKFNINDGYIKLFSTFLFTFIASYLAALLSYRYVEKPSITLGRRILSIKYKKTSSSSS